VYHISNLSSLQRAISAVKQSPILKGDGTSPGVSQYLSFVDP
jgi:hypothetical protein